MDETLKTIEGMYLPGFMTLLKAEYDVNSSTFDFKPVEPNVYKDLFYLTPRGVHIFVSQAGYWFTEKLAQEGLLDMAIPELREYYKGLKIKLTEFNVRMRKEIGLKNNLKGRLDLNKLRPGKLPVMKLDFDIENRAISGNITGVITHVAIPQTNRDIMRGN